MRVFNKAAVAIAALMCLSAASHATLRPFLIAADHAPTDTIDTVADQVGENYFLKIEELKAIPRLRTARIKTIPGRPGIVNLADIGQVSIDELNAILNIRIKPELLEPVRITNGFANNKFRIPDEPPITSLMVDYDLRAEKTSSGLRYGLIGTGSAWVMGTRIDAGMVAGTDVQPQLTQLRAVKEDLENSALIEAGTIFGSAGSRASPGQILGIGFRRDRGITPGFITGPNLKINGVATAQSTIDVLVNNQLKSTTVQPGPFSVTADPVINGGVASVTVVVRDALGMETVVSERLWATPSLLGTDQAEYALSAGALSTGGLTAKGFVVSGYYRTGVTNWLTAEVGSQLSAPVKRLTAAADFGTIVGDFAVDTSFGGGRTSSARYAMPTVSLGPWAVSGGAQISSTSADFQLADGTFANRTAINQRALSLSATKQDWSLSSTFAATNTGTFVSASLGHTINESGASVSVTAMRTTNTFGNASNSINVSLSIPLGGTYVSASASQTSAGVRKSVSMSRSFSEQFSGSVSADGLNNEFDHKTADASFQVGSASANFGVSQYEGQQAQYRGAMRGGFIVSSKGITAKSPGASDAGFAIVDLGVPEVGVYNGTGQKIFTDQSGVAVLSLPSLTDSTITIDVDSAPDNLDLSSFKTVVNRRGGVLLERHPVETNGQFVKIPGVKPGDVLQINGEIFPITDRGVWLDMKPGDYTGTVSGVKKDIHIK